MERYIFVQRIKSSKHKQNSFFRIPQQTFFSHMMPGTISYQCRVSIYLPRKITVLKIRAVARLPLFGFPMSSSPELKLNLLITG